MRTTVKVCVPWYGHFWFRLVTYSSQRELVEATKKHSGIDLDTDEDCDTAGVFSAHELRSDNYLGIMRLYDVSTETIVHESVHAASCLAKKAHGRSRTLSDAKEEAIAYGTQAINTAVHAVIYPEEHQDEVASPFGTCPYASRGYAVDRG